MLKKKDSVAPFGVRLKRDMTQNWTLYLLVLPVLVFYTIFCYMPMYGALMAFKDYSPKYGILGSPWAGMKYFEEFITNPYFWRILKNTLWISVSTLIFSFPAPILLALLINEIKQKWFAKTVQTLSYLPHFISLVVVCSLIKEFTASDGVINDFLTMFGIPRQTMLNNPHLFVPVYVASDIWQSIRSLPPDTAFL